MTRRATVQPAVAVYPTGRWPQARALLTEARACCCQQGLRTLSLPLLAAFTRLRTREKSAPRMASVKRHPARFRARAGCLRALAVDVHSAEGPVRHVPVC